VGEAGGAATAAASTLLGGSNLASFVAGALSFEKATSLSRHSLASMSSSWSKTEPCLPSAMVT